MPAPGRYPPAARPHGNAAGASLRKECRRRQRIPALQGGIWPRNDRTASSAPYRSRSLCAPSANRSEALGLVRKRKQPLAVRDRDHAIARAMQNQKRRRHLADPRVGAERILHQQPDRQKPIGRGADVGRRGERRFQHEAADPVASPRAQPRRRCRAIRRTRRCAVAASARRQRHRLLPRRRSDPPRTGCPSNRRSRDSSAQRGRCHPRQARGSDRRDSAARRRCRGSRAPTACPASAARTRRSPSRRRRCRARSPAHRTDRPPPAAYADAPGDTSASAARHTSARRTRRTPPRPR